MINPNNSGGNVERWLVEVEIMMKKGLAYAIDMSMVDHASSDRMDWVQKWPGQVRTRQQCVALIMPYTISFTEKMDGCVLRPPHLLSQRRRDKPSAGTHRSRL